jgi:hypothetical protein
MLNSVCYYIGNFNLTLLDILKTQDQNQIKIDLKVEPGLAYLWDNIDFMSMITIANNNGNTSLLDGIDSFSVVKGDNGSIQIVLNYNADIYGNNFTISVNPSNSGILVLNRTQSSSKSIIIIPDDNQGAYYYSPDNYGIASIA